MRQADDQKKSAGLRPRLVARVMAALEWKPMTLVKRTVQEFQDDDCMHMAAGIAYYAMFSIFPLMLGLIAALGLILEPAEVQGQIALAVTVYVPGAADLIASTVEGVVASRGTISLMAVIGLFWSATAIFSAIRRSVNRAWDIERQRPFVLQKVVELSMVLGTGFLFILSTGTTAVYRAMSRWEVPLLGLGTIGDNPAWRAIGLLLPLFFTFVIFTLIYRILPNTRVSWRDVWPGALLASIAFEGAKNAFVWYLENFATYNLVYGPLTSVIVFLFWAYISAVILLLGAELASEYSWLYGTRSKSQPKAE